MNPRSWSEHQYFIVLDYLQRHAHRFEDEDFLQYVDESNPDYAVEAAIEMAACYRAALDDCNRVAAKDAVRFAGLIEGVKRLLACTAEPVSDY